MKTLKNYTLVLTAIVLSSTISFGQIVVTVAKKKDKDKEKKEEQTTVNNNKTEAVTEIPGEEVKQEAEPEPKTFTLSGSIDVYAHTALGKTNQAFGTGAPTTSFGNLKGFALGMANLIASYQGEKAGFTADLVFGPRGSDAVFNSGGYRNVAGAGSAHIVNQLFTYLKVSDAVTFNLGQFNTFVGFEVISPTLNTHYSTSYLFSNGPFNHTGFRTDFTFGNGMVAKVAIMNPTDILEFNPVSTYTLGGQIGYSGDAGGIWLNALYGDYDGKLKKDGGEKLTSAGNTFQIDLTTGWTLSDKFYLGFNTSMQSTGAGEVRATPTSVITDATGDASSFFGAAIYPKLTLSENFALGLRAEYFSTKKFHVLASPIYVDTEGDGNVTEFTLSANYKVGALTLLPELRYDKLSGDGFADSDGVPTDSMISATFAAIYKF